MATRCLRLQRRDEILPGALVGAAHRHDPAVAERLGASPFDHRLGILGIEGVDEALLHSERRPGAAAVLGDDDVAAVEEEAARLGDALGPFLAAILGDDHRQRRGDLPAILDRAKDSDGDAGAVGAFQIARGFAGLRDRGGRSRQRERCDGRSESQSNHHRAPAQLSWSIASAGISASACMKRQRKTTVREPLRSTRSSR